MRTGAFFLGVGLLGVGLGCAPVISYEDGGPGGPAKEPQAGASCHFGASNDATTAVLAWMRGNDLVVVFADGHEGVPFTFAEGKGASATWAQITARDGFVAVAATSYLLDGGYTSESVLLSKQGEVLWKSGDIPAGYVSHALGEKGTLAVGVWDNGQSATLLVWPDGKTVTVPGIVPVGGPSVKGRFPAMLTPDTYQLVYGWGAPGEEPEPLAFDASWNGAPFEAKGSLYYVGLKDPESGALLFVRESETDLQTFPLPTEAPWLGAVAAPFALVHGNWMWDAPQFLADTEKGSFQQIGSVPAGLTAFGMAYYNGPTVDEQGQVWLALRSGTTGGLYRTKGQGWEQVGRSFSGIWDTTVVARGGTVVLGGSDRQGYFPMDAWESPPAGEPGPDHTGPFVEVLRPEEGLVHELPADAGTFALTRSGGCVAYATPQDMRVLDVASGETVDLGPIDPQTGPIAAVWIE